MPKRIITTLAAILIFNAHDLRAEQEGDFEYSIKDNNAIITKYTGAGGALTIPSTMNKLTVTGIAANAFIGRKTLTSVSVPDGITSIGDIAFGDCEKLAKV